LSGFSRFLIEHTVLSARAAHKTQNNVFEPEFLCFFFRLNFFF